MFKQKKINVLFFLSLLIILVGALFFLNQKPDPEPSYGLPSLKKEKERIYEKLKSEKKKTNEQEMDQREMAKQRMNQNSFKKLDEASIKADEPELQHSYLFEEGDFSLFYEDLESKSEDSNDSLNVNSLENQMNLQILLEQKKKQYDEAEKEAFIKAFLKNAREKGYIIQLNENLEVTGVIKIETP